MFDLSQVCSPSFPLGLKRLHQGLTRSIAVSQLISKLLNFSHLDLLGPKVSPMLFKVLREFVQHALQELATEKPFAAPTPLEDDLLDREVIRSDVVQNEVHTFGLNFLVEVSFVESFHEVLDGLVGILKTTDEELALTDACFVDRGVGLYIRDREVRVKYFIEPLLPDTESG